VNEIEDKLTSSTSRRWEAPSLSTAVYLRVKIPAGSACPNPTTCQNAEAASIPDFLFVPLIETVRLMQSQSSELQTTSLQELKRLVHQLKFHRNILSQNQQRLIEELDGLQAERNTLAAELQQLQKQQEGIQQQCEHAVEETDGAALDALLAALRYVFPYSAYRQQRPDLASYSDQDLVDHFVAYGIHEGVPISFGFLEAELQQLRSSLQDANAKAELFNQKSNLTAAQLDLLKDLFTKMNVQP